jgi:hypothetical protein
VRAEGIAALQERGLERTQELTTRQGRAVHRDSMRRAFFAHGILFVSRSRRLIKEGVYGGR